MVVSYYHVIIDMKSKVIRNSIDKFKRNPFVIIAIVLYILQFFCRNVFTANVTKFNREVGVAASHNLDISSVLSYVYALYLIAFPFLILGATCIVGIIWKALVKKNEIISTEFMKMANIYSFFVCILIFGEMLQKFDTQAKFSKVCDIGILVLISMLAYPFLRKISTQSLQDLKWIVIIGLNISVLLAFFTTKLQIVYVVVIVVMILSLNRIDNDYGLKNAFSVIAYYISLAAVTLEGIIILNQWGIYVRRVWIALGLTFVFLFGIGLLRFKGILKVNSNKLDSTLEWGMMFGGVCFAGLPAVQSTALTDLFEQANSGVPFQQLVQFGKIPFLETISAHLGSDWIPNLFYYIFNRDMQGALFTPYTVVFNTVWVLLLFYIMKQFFKSEQAMLFCLCFPFFSYYVSWESLNIISVCAVILIKKKDSMINMYIYWICLLCSVLYKADLGLAFGIGAIISYILIKFLRREKIDWKKFIISGGIVAIFAIGIFVIGCLVKGIAVFPKIREFLEIFGSSNEVWAYSERGTRGTLQYTIIYFFVPVLVVGLVIFYCGNIKKGKTHNEVLDIVILNFGIAYLVNLQRIIVRHNLSEAGFVVDMTFTAGFLIALIVFSFAKNNNIELFTMTLLLFSVFFAIDKTSIMWMGNTTEASTGNLALATVAVEKFEDGEIIDKYHYDSKIERVQISQEMQSKYTDIVEEINQVLVKNETFFDFSNQSLLYALSNKTLPVYVVQSPGQISGEYGQRKFIEEIEQNNCPIAISACNEGLNLCSSVDGIQHSYRQYLISEYLNNNYKPVENVNGFTVWVKNGRDDIEQKIVEHFKKIEISSETGATHNCRIEKKGEGTRICATGEDPYVENLEIPEMAGGEYTLSIRYHSDSVGKLQIFYTENPEYGYTEDKAVSFDLQYTGVIQLTLDAMQARYIRLDIPDESIVEIEDCFIREGRYSLSGYEYGDYTSLHVYNIGYIPYLWGECDTRNASDGDIIAKCKKKDGSYAIEYDNIKGNGAAYLKLTIKSEEDIVGSISFGKNYDNKYMEQMRYNINIVSGVHTYLIRMTVDSNWQRGLIDTLKCDVDQANIEEIDIIEGD